MKLEPAVEVKTNLVVPLVASKSESPSRVKNPSEPVENPSEPVENPSEPAENPSEPVEQPSDPVEKPSEPILTVNIQRVHFNGHQSQPSAVIGAHTENVPAHAIQQ